MNLARKLYYSLSPRQRLAVRRLVYLPVDAIDALRGRDPLTPRRGDIYIGSGDFRKQGRLVVDLMKRYAGLKPGHSVLDIGSGIGRVAVALTEYLSPDAQYEGFDVVKKGVDWCQGHITKRYPNFRFRFIPLRNELYNLDTEAEAAKFTFPYADSEFDRTVLISVFTHMVAADVRNYFHEISRVMKPGGKCFASFFVVDDDVMNRTEGGKAYFNFDHKADDGCYLLTEKCKEADVAYTRAMIEEFAAESGLTIEKFERGTWTGLPSTEGHPFFQDIYVFTKS